MASDTGIATDLAALEAARDAEAVSGLSEALRHLERVLDLWDHVPRAQEVAGVAISTLLTWAGELVSKGGNDRSRPGRSPRRGADARAPRRAFRLGGGRARSAR